MRRLNIASGLQRGIRALVIWRAVLTLLLLFGGTDKLGPTAVVPHRSAALNVRNNALSG